MNAKIDGNNKPTLIGVSSTDGVTPVLWAIDPITGRALVDLASGSGTVTSISQGTGITLTPNPITTSGTVALANTAVTPGSYVFASITVDQQGRITSASSGTAGTGTVTSVNSADGNATISNTTSTPVITIVSAPKLTTPRTIAGVSFDGSANISLNNNAITNGAGYTTNTGTVTSIAVTTANGVSGTSSGGATPSLTLTLGAITPTSTNGVSAATMGYLDATSSIQTQLNGKSPTAGSTSLITLGTITTGVWNGTAIADGYIASTLTGKSINGVTLNGAGSSGLFLNQAGGYTAPVAPAAVINSGTTTYNLTTASGTQNIAHGLGKVPSYIRINAGWANTGGSIIVNSVGAYNGTNTSSIETNNFVPNGNLVSSTYIITMYTSSIDYQTATITVTSTNIVLSWTKTNSPSGTLYILWEAQ